MCKHGKTLLKISGEICGSARLNSEEEELHIAETRHRICARARCHPRSSNSNTLSRPSTSITGAQSILAHL